MSGENIKFIFKRALTHYISILENLKNDKEIEFSNDIFREDIQLNINKLNDIIKGFDTYDALMSVEQNRELLCSALQSYIQGLENMKKLIESKLQTSEPSLPTIKFMKVEVELELAKIRLVLASNRIAQLPKLPVVCPTPISYQNYY
jgi:hypothetical protein